MIEVTNHCKLKCITCPREYTYGEEMDKDYIGLNNLKKIINETYPYIDSIGLTGLGETFLYKDLEDAVNYIRQKSKGIIISASINAHLKNSPEIAERLINKIDTIQISIDGINDVYNRIRLNADFSFFLSNTRIIIESAENSQTDIMFNVVLVKENYKQMSDLINFTHDLRIRFLNFTPVNLVSTTLQDIFYYRLFSSDEFLKELKTAKKEAEKFPELEFTCHDFNSKSGFNNCHFPWSHFYITWDGYIPPCCAKPFPKVMNFGNVFEKRLIDCLNSTEFRKFRKLWYANLTPDFCNKCFVIDLHSKKELEKNP